MVAREGSDPSLLSRTLLERVSDREIVITRAFDGPARIVFEAWTRPELVRRWWAPRSLGVSMVECVAEVEAGGRYRYVLKPEHADAIAFSGQYSEVTPHSRLVYSMSFEPKGAGPIGDPAIVTVTFDERDGKTQVVSHEVYPSKEVLDGVLATGMEEGLRATMDQLDELVRSLR